jgi:hypothetical protein
MIKCPDYREMNVEPFECNSGDRQLNIIYHRNRVAYQILKAANILLRFLIDR